MEEAPIVPEIRRNSVKKLEYRSEDEERGRRPVRPVSVAEVNGGGGWRGEGGRRARSSSLSNRNKRRAEPPPLSQQAISALAKPPQQPLLILQGEFSFLYCLSFKFVTLLILDVNRC